MNYRDFSDMVHILATMSQNKRHSELKLVFYLKLRCFIAFYRLKLWIDLVKNPTFIVLFCFTLYDK